MHRFLSFHLRIALIVLAVATNGVSANAQDSLWAVYAKSGAEEYQKGKYKEAAEILEKAVAEIDSGQVVNASSIEARCNLAKCYRSLSRYKDAEKAFVKACETAGKNLPVADPVAVEAAFQLASTYAERGKDQDALLFAEWLETVVRDDSKASRASSIYQLIADAHIKAKAYDQADKALESALKHATERYRLRGYFLGKRHEKIAEVATLRMDFPAAAKAYMKAAEQYAADFEDEFLRGNTMDAASYWNAAVAFKKAKDEKATEDAFDKAEDSYETHLQHFEAAKGKFAEQAINIHYRLMNLDEARDRFASAEKRLTALLLLAVGQKGKGSAEAAEVQFRLSAFHTRRKNPVEAERWLRTALTDREAKTGKDSPDLAACLNRLAGYLSDNGKHEEAEKLLRRNVANCRAGGGQAERALAAACTKLAYHLEQHAAQTECFALLKEALGLYEKLDGENARSVADTLDSMAWRVEQREVRLPLARRAKAIIEATGYRDWRYRKAVNTLGSAFAHNGAYSEAIACYRECLALHADWTPGEPTPAAYHNNIALGLEVLDRFEEGEGEFRKAIDPVHTKGESPYQIAKGHANFAGFYLAWGKPVEAEKLARKAFELRDGDSGKESPVLATSLGQLACLEARSGKFAAAEALLDRAAAIRTKYIRDNEQESPVANAFEGAWRHHHHGRWSEAEKDLAELFRLAEKFKLPDVSSAIFSSLAGTYWADLADAWELRGCVALERGDPDRAEEHFRKALATHEKYHKDTSRHAAILLHLARCDAARGDADKAAERTQRAVGMVEKSFGKDHPQTAGAKELAAELVLRRGRDDPRKALKDVLALREKDATAKPALLRTKVLLAEAEARHGDAKAAVKTLDELAKEHGEMYGKEHYGRHALLYAAAEASGLANNKPKALELYRQALAIRQAIYGKGHELCKACEARIAEIER